MDLKKIEKNKWYWIDYGEPRKVKVVEIFSEKKIMIEYWTGVYGYDSGHGHTIIISLKNFLKEIEDPRPAPPEPFLVKIKRWTKEFKNLWE